MSGQGKRILVVEDDSTIADVISDILELEGYQVLTAPEGRAALELIQRERVETIDLVVLDLFMPVMDGFELLAQLERLHLDVPVVVMSASRADLAKAARAPHSFLKKPFELLELVRTVEGACRKA